jgi:hypothetical protein
MRTALQLLLAFLVLGPGVAAIDAESGDERLFDICVSVAAAAISATWFFFARRRSANRHEFDRVMGFSDIDWRELGAWTALLVALPVALYALIEHSLRVETTNQGLLAASLAVAGMIALVWYKSR